MSCDIGEVMERLENELILQPFRCFTYVTVYSPTFLSLLLRLKLFTYSPGEPSMITMNPNNWKVTAKNDRSPFSLKRVYTLSFYNLILKEYKYD